MSSQQLALSGATGSALTATLLTFLRSVVQPVPASQPIAHTVHEQVPLQGHLDCLCPHDGGLDLTNQDLQALVVSAFLAGIAIGPFLETLSAFRRYWKRTVRGARRGQPNRPQPLSLYE